MPATRRWSWSMRALGGRLGEQWERERRDTLFLLGATLLAALPHVAHLPPWTSAAFGVLFLWRLGLVMSGRPLPPDALRWLAAFAAIVAVFAHYRTLLGRDPGVALLVLFLGLKMMEMRARRDLFVVLFLCFFLLITGFFYSQSLASAALSLAAVWALLACMLTMQFGEKEAPIAARFTATGSLMLQALPIAAALFVLFPRMHTPLWHVSGEGTGARTGLSGQMTPGNIAQLTESDDVAFRVRFAERFPPTDALYWRGPVFGAYDGQTWRPLVRRAADAPPLEVTYSRASPPIAYTVTLEPTNQPWLFALEAPIRLELDDLRATVSPELVVTAEHPLDERVRYEATSVIEYASGVRETEASLREWTALPRDTNPRTRELARTWRASSRDDAELVDRALRMIRDEPFRYTFSPPPLGRDAVDDFIFGTRAGFCEHYASAFVVLMRAAGVPARIVTGYQGAERNPHDGYWIVRQSDAHAWAEVWLNGSGWTRVDPTQAVAPQRIERGMRALREQLRRETADGPRELLRSWRLQIDALANAWNQWVLSYDRQRQARLFERLGLATGDWLDLAGALAVVLAVLLGAAAVVTLHPRRPRDPVERLYAAFCDRLAAAGLPRAPHETAGRFVARIERALEPEQLVQARRIVGTYNDLRYAAPRRDPRDVRHLRRNVRAFRP